MESGLQLAAVSLVNPYDEEYEEVDLPAFLKKRLRLEEQEMSCLPNWFHSSDLILVH